MKMLAVRNFICIISIFLVVLCQSISLVPSPFFLLRPLFLLKDKCPKSKIFHETKIEGIELGGIELQRSS